MANERRLVDATEAEEWAQEHIRDAKERYTILEFLMMCSTVDAVEVVRCKYCCWRGSENCAMFYRCDCGEQHTWETDNDFCSYGKRRTTQPPKEAV